MFVNAVTHLAVPTAVAQDRLLTVLHADGGLQDAAVAAFRTGETVLLRAGFAGVGKQVAVHCVPGYLRGETTVIPLQWVATGPAGELFPAMDANLELDPTPDGHCRLTLIGNYRPPLGRVGVRLDQVLLHRAARATARSLLNRVGRGILATHPARHAPSDPVFDHHRRTAPRWPGPLSLPPPAERPPTV
ncbi:MAG TPA: hypothetical protein VIJ23_10430 [Mycobacterium sp.]|jgi:hypothetical protein